MCATTIAFCYRVLECKFTNSTVEQLSGETLYNGLIQKSMSNSQKTTEIISMLRIFSIIVRALLVFSQKLWAFDSIVN